MTCRDLVQFLGDYFDGALPDAVRQTFESHLDDCAACRAYLAAYRDVLRLARELRADDDALPGNVPEALVTAVLDARRALSG